MARAAEEVGDAADALLEVVGVADHLRVEAGAGHDGEAFLLEAPDVDLARPPVQPDLHRLLELARDAQVGGEQVRRPGREHRERDLGAGEHAQAAAHGAVAAPGEDEIGAGVERTLDLPGRLLGLGHLVPERLLDARLGERASQRRQPLAERLRRVRDDRDLHDDGLGSARGGPGAGPARGLRERGDAGGPAREQQHQHRADADQRARGDVERVVHAAVHAREGDEDRKQEGDHPGRQAPAALRERRREQQHEAAVDGERRGGVAGRVARVGRQVLQPRDVRPVARDDDRGDAVGRGLDHEHEHGERGDPPLALDRADDRDQADQDRQHRRAAHHRADRRDIGEEAGALAHDRHDRALVGAADAARVDEHVGDEQPEQDRQAREDREARERGGEEHRGWMPALHGSREPLGRSSRPSLQHGHDPVVPRPAVRRRARVRSHWRPPSISRVVLTRGHERPPPHGHYP